MFVGKCRKVDVKNYMNRQLADVVSIMFARARGGRIRGKHVTGTDERGDRTRGMMTDSPEHVITNASTQIKAAALTLTPCGRDMNE